MSIHDDILLVAGVDRSNITQSSASEQSNSTEGADVCAACGNCTLNALVGGRIFLPVTGESRCPPPRTWLIDSGRDSHVVQLSVERHLPATTRPETVEHALKVLSYTCRSG